MQNQKKEKTRAFICIDFPDEVIKEVAKVQQILQKNTKFTGKIIEQENLHLTLKFLGEIDKLTLTKVKKELEKIKFAPLTLMLSDVGTFNYKNNPRIVWIKINGEIFKLQKQIDELLSPISPKEERFMSHLTIARIKYVKDREYFTSYIRNIKIKKLKFDIDNFKLKSSELFPSGPVYKTIEAYSTKN